MQPGRQMWWKKSGGGKYLYMCDCETLDGVFRCRSVSGDDAYWVGTGRRASGSQHSRTGHMWVSLKTGL